MEPEKKDETIQDVQKAANELKQNVKNLTEEIRYSRFKYFSIISIGFLFIVAVILFVLIMKESVNTDLALANVQKELTNSNKKFSALQNRVLKMEKRIDELQAAKSDSRSENCFLPGDCDVLPDLIEKAGFIFGDPAMAGGGVFSLGSQTQALGVFPFGKYTGARRVLDLEIKTLSCVGSSDNPDCIDLSGKPVYLTDRQKIIYSRHLENLLKKHREKPLK